MDNLNSIPFTANNTESLFKDSPFGEHWDKYLPGWIVPYYNSGTVIIKNNFQFIDESKTISHSSTDRYAALSGPKDFKYIIYADTDGGKVISMYDDPANAPLPNQVLIFMELEDGKFDFGKIVRVKLGLDVIKDLKYNVFSELPYNDTDEDDISRYFIEKLKTLTKPEFRNIQAEVNDNPDFEDALTGAIKYDYESRELNNLSWFLVLLRPIEYFDFNISRWLFDLSAFLRKQKIQEEKYWNGALPSVEYEPLLLPQFVLDLEDEEINLSNITRDVLEGMFEVYTKTVTQDFFGETSLGTWLKAKTDDYTARLQKELTGLLNGLGNISLPLTDIVAFLKHLNAFYIGLYNGIVELTAGLIDIVAIIAASSNGSLSYKMTDKLTEGLENIFNLAFYNTQEFFKLCWEKFRGAVREYIVWRDDYKGKSYQICKVTGELLPDILTIVIAWMKGAKVADAAAGLANATEKAITREAAQEAVQKLEREGVEEISNEAVQQAKKKLDDVADMADEAAAPAKANRKQTAKRLEDKKNARLARVTLGDYLKLRKKYLALEKEELTRLWTDAKFTKKLRRAELKNMYDFYIAKYPKLEGANFAEFRVKIYKNGEVVDDVLELSHSGPKKLYDDFLDTVEDEKFLEHLIDDIKPRKNDSEVKFIYNFLQNHVQRGDYFIIETKNIFIACDSCKRELLVLKELLGKKGKITIISNSEVEGTKSLKRYLNRK
jgi:hypothetical protein